MASSGSLSGRGSYNVNRLFLVDLCNHPFCVDFLIDFRRYWYYNQTGGGNHVVCHYRDCFYSALRYSGATKRLQIISAPGIDPGGRLYPVESRGISIRIACEAPSAFISGFYSQNINTRFTTFYRLQGRLTASSMDYPSIPPGRCTFLA